MDGSLLSGPLSLKTSLLSVLTISPYATLTCSDLSQIAPKKIGSRRLKI